MAAATAYPSASQQPVQQEAALQMSSGARSGVAAHWHVVDQLWRPADDDRSKVNLLDCLRSSSDGVVGWLFTAVDGTLKSKGRGKWNYGSIMDRICYDCPIMSEDALYSHYTRDGFTWHQTTNDVVKEFVASPFPGVLITFSHIKSPSKPLYIEQTYSHAFETDMNFKVTTHLLAGAVPKPSAGKAATSSSTSVIPPQRLQSMNKAVNEQAKSFIVELVRTVEKRTGNRIAKMVCVLLMESDAEDPKLWLHHVKEIAYPKTAKLKTAMGTPRGSEHRATMSQYDRKSVTCSEVSYNMASFQRFSKCQGDFCSYAAAEEEEALVGSGEAEEALSSVLDESKKARIRIRMTIGKDYSDIKTGETKQQVRAEEEEVGNDEDHVIIRPRTGGDVTGSSEGALGERPLEDDSTPEVSAFIAAGKRSVARQVPYKSIALARQDMGDIEGEGEVHYAHAAVPWPELLYHWYWRTGRAYAQKKGSVPVPQSSGHGITVAKLTAGASAIPQLPRVPEQDEGSSVDAGSVAVPPLGLLRPSVHLNVPPGDRDTAARGGANAAGQLSWYYSQARVCETCYQVYRDMDRRREQKQLQLLRAQRKAADAEEEARGRDIERRIFDQRMFVSRLTANPTKKTKPQEQQQQQHSGSVRFVSAPKGVVPPVPWRLADAEHGEEYSTWGSRWTRKLQARVQEVQGLNESDRRNKEQENMRRKIVKGMQGSSQGDGDGDDVDFEAEELQRWRELTGADRPVQNNSASTMTKKTMRMVGPGGIGKKVSVRDFDADKLLHPWQRSMNDMRQQLEEADGDMSMALRRMQLNKLKSKTKGMMRRTQSLPPLQQQNSLLNTSQITMDSALFDDDFGHVFDEGSVALAAQGKSTKAKGSISKGQDGYAGGFVGLRDREELYDDIYNSTKKASIQIRKNDGDRGGTSRNSNAKTFSLSITSKTEKLQQLPAVQRMGESLSPDKERSARVVSFGEGRGVAGPAANPNPNLKGVSLQDAVRGAMRAVGVYRDDEDGDDDDDDDDDAIGWSPFVIPQAM